jgi:MraZ protein
LLTGTFARSVDEKLRVAIPKRIRESFGTSPEPWLYVTPGTDGSIAIYTEAALGGLAARMAAASPAQQDVRAFNRLFYARAERVEIDAQGRIRLPPALASLAGLTKEAVMLGVQDHLELWDRTRWESYLAEKTGQFDQIAESALSTHGTPTLPTRRDVHPTDSA